MPDETTTDTTVEQQQQSTEATPPAAPAPDPAAADELNRLRTHNQRLLGELKSARSELQTVRSQVEALQNQQQTKTQESESELETIKNQLAALQAERDAAKAAEKRAEFNSQLTTRLSTPKYQLYNPNQFVKFFGSAIEDSETGLVYRDGDRAVPLDNWIETLRNDPNNQNLFRAPASGAGGDPSGRSAVPSSNPFKKETFNLTEQMRLIRENPERAEKLRAEAGN